jgi:hypothetical protein
MEEETYYNVEMSIQGINIVYSALSHAVDRWAGGEPQEQEDLMAMRDNFYRIVLEHKFESM